MSPDVDGNFSPFTPPPGALEQMREAGVDPNVPTDPVEPKPDLRQRLETAYQGAFGNQIGKFSGDAPETSRKAAIGVYFRTGTQKHRLLSLVAKSTNQGQDITCDEAEVITGLPHQSASARWNELENDYKMIEATGETRKTRAGSEARSFILTDAGCEYIAAHGMAA